MLQNSAVVDSTGTVKWAAPVAGSYAFTAKASTATGKSASATYVLKVIPATGKQIEITGNDIFEFDEGGKVVDHWHEADHLLLYQQVGGEIRAKA